MSSRRRRQLLHLPPPPRRAWTPLAGRERAEEAEQHNQKQTCIADIADLKLILSEENVPLVQLARGVRTPCPYGVC